MRLGLGAVVIYTNKPHSCRAIVSLGKTRPPLHFPTVLFLKHIITSKFKLNSAAAQLIKPRDAIARELGLLLGVI